MNSAMPRTNNTRLNAALLNYVHQANATALIREVLREDTTLDLTWSNTAARAAGSLLVLGVCLGAAASFVSRVLAYGMDEDSRWVDHADHAVLAVRLAVEGDRLGILDCDCPITLRRFVNPSIHFQAELQDSLLG